MAAFAAGFGRAYLARVVQGRTRREPVYIGPNDYVPSSTADLWKGARPRRCR